MALVKIIDVEAGTKVKAYIALAEEMFEVEVIGEKTDGDKTYVSVCMQSGREVMIPPLQKVKILKQ